MFLGLVFGRGMAAVFGQNTVAGLAAVLAALSVFRSRGNPAHSASIFRAFGALVPGAMSRVDTQYRESAFSIGCQYKIMGNRPLTSRSTGRQKRTAFGSLRWRSGAGYLCVRFKRIRRVRCQLSRLIMPTMKPGCFSN